MWNRITLRCSGQKISEAFGITEIPELAPRYNIAPNQRVSIVQLDSKSGTRRLVLACWELVPS